jgi:hypothetical protein
VQNVGLGMSQGRCLLKTILIPSLVFANIKHLFHVEQPIHLVFLLLNLPQLAHAIEAVMGCLLVFNTFWSNYNGYTKLLYFLQLSMSWIIFVQKTKIIFVTMVTLFLWIAHGKEI